MKKFLLAFFVLMSPAFFMQSSTAWAKEKNHVMMLANFERGDKVLVWAVHPSGRMTKIRPVVIDWRDKTIKATVYHHGDIKIVVEKPKPKTPKWGKKRLRINHN